MIIISKYISPVNSDMKKLLNYKTPHSPGVRLSLPKIPVPGSYSYLKATLGIREGGR